MAKKSKFSELANNIVELMGGESNIGFFAYCVTRLRFTVKDRGRVDEEKIKKIPGVVGTAWSGDQFQIIIGQSVGDAYKEICKVTGLGNAKEEETEESKKKGLSINAILDAFSGCLVPLMPLLIGAGLIKILMLVLQLAKVIDSQDASYIVLNFVSDSAFYFLPVFVGATAAKKFGANMALGMFIGGILIHPTFVSSVSEGTALSIFKLPIYAGTYSYTVFPVIFAVYIMAHVERFFAKKSPDILRSIIEPFMTLLIMVPLTLCLIAPIGGFLGNYLTTGIIWLYDTSGFIGVAVFSSLLPFIIMTGMHYGFGPYIYTSLATLKYEPIYITSNFIYNFNQGAAALAVGVKTKDVDLKSTAMSCGVTAVLAGVTEPCLYGVNVKLKTPLWCSIIGSFIGGAIAGLFKVYAFAVPGTAGVFGIPTFINTNISNLVHAVIAIVLGFIITFVLTLIVYKDQEN